MEEATAGGDVAMLLGRIRDGGGRVTVARRAVLAALLEAGEHPTADDLAVLVHRTNPEIHRSTIYRTLDALEEAGLLEHCHLGHGRAVYHRSDDRQIHLVCEGCSGVVHLADAELEELRRRLVEAHGFRLDSRHFALPGLCRTCADAADGAEGRTGP